MQPEPEPSVVVLRVDDIFDYRELALGVFAAARHPMWWHPDGFLRVAFPEPKFQRDGDGSALI
jgi:hypothetical protein